MTVVLAVVGLLGGRRSKERRLRDGFADVEIWWWIVSVRRLPLVLIPIGRQYHCHVMCSLGVGSGF